MRERWQRVTNTVQGEAQTLHLYLQLSSRAALLFVDSPLTDWRWEWDFFSCSGGVGGSWLMLAVWSTWNAWGRVELHKSHWQFLWLWIHLGGLSFLDRRHVRAPAQETQVCGSLAKMQGRNERGCLCPHQHLCGSIHGLYLLLFSYFSGLCLLELQDKGRKFGNQ